MCGIVACVGTEEAPEVILNGLVRLEYRGYDSAGIAVQNGRGLDIRKVSGNVGRLRELLRDRPSPSTVGIGHTRWATHGGPTEANAHPHLDCSGTVAVVHNGIIENAQTLRTHLRSKGHVFRSETDTEVLAHLVEAEESGNLEDRVARALARVEGAYGIAVISSDDPTKVVVARNGSPLLLGVGKDGRHFAASDPAAILEHTRSVVYLEDGDLAVITPGGYRVLDRNGERLDRRTDQVDWELEAIELGGYRHFMEKEIANQPDTLRDALRGRLNPDTGQARLNGLNLEPDYLGGLERIVILGCGTSWHAGLVGRFLIESLAGIPVEVEYASEFRYRRSISLRNALVVAISQSGETADTLEAIRAARSAGARVVGIVNVVGSTIARETDGGVYLHAGPEISVASTKAFTAQLGVLALAALFLGRQRGLSDRIGMRFARAVADLPGQVARALELGREVREVAERYHRSDHFLFLGRGVSFPVALEGALKLKEISYIHAEGYPAAELKHGPIALIDERMPVVVVAPGDHLFAKVLSNLEEVKARGGRTIVISDRPEAEFGGAADHLIRVPGTLDLLSPVLTAIPLQLLAYEAALLRGCNVDRPRNLAKSVTVE